jgi:hypothetical protein
MGTASTPQEAISWIVFQPSPSLQTSLRSKQTLSMVRMSKNSINRKRKQPSTITHPPERGFHVMQRGNCILYPYQHSLFACSEYERKSIEERRTIIRTRNLCFNCLGNHRNPESASSQGCNTCIKRHHNLLHQSPPMKGMRNPSRATKSKVTGATMGRAVYRCKRAHYQDSYTNKINFVSYS